LVSLLQQFKHTQNSLVERVKIITTWEQPKIGIRK
jgi:hypothetical protein